MTANQELKRLAYMIATHFITFYILALFFGAPIFSMIIETATFSIFLTSLCVAPLLIYCGTRYIHLLDLFSISRPKKHERFAKIIIIFTLFGAWVGSFVIPLDWDRWWQVWPISNCIAMTVCSFLGWITHFYVALWYPNVISSL